MYLSTTTTTLANGFTDVSERHELVIGARFANSVFLVLNSWLQLQINILFFDNSRIILRGLKLKKNEKWSKFSGDTWQHEKYNWNVGVFS